MSDYNYHTEKLERQLLQIKKITDSTANVLNSALASIDFSYLAKAQEDYVQNIVPVLSSVQKIYAPYHELSVKLTESMTPYIAISKKLKQLSEVTPPIIETIKSFSKVVNQATIKYQAINKLGDHQLIWFGNLSEEVAINIISNDRPDIIIKKYLEETNYEEIDRVIVDSNKSSFLREKKVLYCQSINAYQNSCYELSCIGLISIIDFLMSKTSGDLSTKSKNHIKIIIEKIKTNKVLDNFEFCLFAIFLSFETVINSLFSYSDFSENEPAILNRHWLTHGRTQREYQKLDCVKLINLIYALLVIGNAQENELSK